MVNFVNYLEFGLKNLNERSLLKTCVVTTGDIAKSIKENFKEYSGRLIPLLIDILTVIINF